MSYLRGLKVALIGIAAMGMGACTEHARMAFDNGTRVEVLSHENVGAFTGSRVDVAQVCEKGSGGYVSIPTSKGPAIPIKLKREQCRLVIAASHGGTGVFPGLVTPVAAAAAFGAAMPATNIAVAGGNAVAKSTSVSKNINTNTLTSNPVQNNNQQNWIGVGGGYKPDHH